MKPILFSTPMVKALLNAKPGTWPAEPIDPGRPCKSQTRMVMKPQPGEGNSITSISAEGFLTVMKYAAEIWTDTDEGESVQLNPPYRSGDILWVKETFQAWGYWFYYYDKESGKERKHFMDETDATHPHLFCGGFVESPTSGMNPNMCGYWKRSSIHMPREVARLFLEVREVRAERLQDMHEDDVGKEGILIDGRLCKMPCGDCTSDDGFDLRLPFIDLWDRINGKGAWESNPWVWVYSFMRVEAEK